MRSTSRPSSRTYRRRTVRRTPYSRTTGMVRKDRADYRIPRVVKPDFKITDTFTNPTSITTAGTVINLTASMTQGANWKNNYIGREVQPVGLDLRFNLVGALSNAFIGSDLNNITKVLLFQWMDDAVPTTATLLESGATAAGPVSPILFSNYNNIEVLYEETFPTFIQAYDPANNYGSSNGYTRRIYIKGKKMRTIEYNNSNGGTAKGQLYLLVISDSALAPSPTFDAYTRLTFLDS